ncbi:hypothetical protein [Salinibacterium sp. PAMC 21357]|uniref:hypothetical protein n=1 Tax=Salinibacterium sp. PAMC 21357 TaxID=1112215 RepID=UPI00028984A3|nr:hypothetical protein [Salinibacterium sp. PAMC 21357]
MPETTDGRSMSNSEAFKVWGPVARQTLIEAASTFGGWITYTELADAIQNRTGVIAKQQLNYWIGGLLEEVSEDAARDGEPRLTSLCLHADESIGDGYPWSRGIADESVREEIAAQDRLECYRRYASNFPAQGAVPALPSKVAKRLERREKVGGAGSATSRDHEVAWIIPSNGGTFDSIAAFAAREEIDWSETTSAGIKTGDTVFLYGTAPTSALTHKCEVVQTGVPFESVIDDREFWRDDSAFLQRKGRSWMRLRLVQTFSAEQREALSLDTMKRHGMKGAPQGRMRVPDTIRSLIVRESTTLRHFWWVNQGGTADRGQNFRHLWAPIRAADGRRMRHWDALEAASRGDIVVHYAHRFVIGTSEVAQTHRSAVRPPDFETGEFTGDTGREVWLDHFQEFDVPVSLEHIPLELRKDDLGEGSPFEHSGKVQQGYFFPIMPTIAAAVFGANGLLEDTSTELEPSIEAYDGDSHSERLLRLNETDGTATVTYRKEQSGLRSLLFGNRATAQCGICSREYPVRFLHTAHIKSRSACTLEERVDWKNIVMPACVFGCDALFEMGLLNVGIDGVISLRGNYDETSSLRLFAKSLEGKVARAFTTENRNYFAWRNAQ